MRVPASAEPDVRLAFQEVWQAINKLTAAQVEFNIDLHGKRLINLGDAVAPTDAATRRQVEATQNRAASGATSDDLQNLTVRQRLRVLGELDLPALDDAAVVFIRNGEVDADESQLSF